MVTGLLVCALSSEIVLTTNSYNFLDTPSAVLGGESWRTTSRVEFKVRLSEPSTEIIPSWNSRPDSGAPLKIWIKPGWEDEPWFCLGEWSFGSFKSSVNDQKNDVGEVLTDTLQLRRAVDRLEVRIEGSDDSKTEALKAFRLIAGPTPSGRKGSKVPFEPLRVPQRAQMSYEGGNVLCSPTSVSMVLAYWADKLVEPNLDHDVPVVQKGVYDPAWKGTGNWAFNVAYAGSLPGMTAFVSRLRGAGDIEDWLTLKVPLVCSVSYTMLKGGPAAKGNDGHLVVLVGFDNNGDPVFNDPGRNVVRVTYQREDFERAWAHSGRTVYLIYPQSWKTPLDGPWPSPADKES